MKTIILMRHSIAEKLDLPTEELPLSREGRLLAAKQRDNALVKSASKCFSSPYVRALETAKIIFGNTETVQDLHERIVGKENAIEDFWHMQYLDYDFKNEGGESLNEVKDRMKKAMDFVLENMQDEDKALVVSHATAICAYLLNFCKIEVIDHKIKLRRITYNGKDILNGWIKPTNYFIIKYADNNEVREIEFVGD